MNAASAQASGSSWPSTSAPAARKVGLVSTRGEVVWWRHWPVETHRDPVVRRRRTLREWWRLVADGARTGRRTPGVDGSQGGRGGRDRAVGQHCPCRRGRVPVGDCLMWMDSRGGELSPTPSWVGRWPATTRARW